MPEGQGSTEEQINKIRSLRRNGHSDRALSLWEEHHHRWGHCPGVYLLGGVLYSDVGRYQEALLAYKDELLRQPHCADAHMNMGVIYYYAKKYHEAIASLKVAILSKPDHALSYYNLGNVMRTLGRDLEAIVYYKQCLRLNPDQRDAWINLAPLLRGQHQWQEARAAYQEILRLDPENETAHYMLQALDEHPPKRAPQSYVKGLFNDYARNFERHLLENLDYKAPHLLEQTLKTLPLPNPTRGLDLGCGTGLAVKAFAQSVTHSFDFVGVDLADQMVQKAKETHLYSKLYVKDILSYLKSASLEAPFDLILALDTFPYLGDLEELFHLLRASLKSGGYLIFTTECLSSHSQEAYKLQTCGRFSHGKSYLEQLALDHSFKIGELSQVEVRQNAGETIHGFWGVWTR